MYPSLLFCFLGSPQILICGESESTAKIHTSDVVASRIEP